MQVDQLKSFLGLAIFIGKMVAPRTETKIDDKAVEVAEKLAANEALLAIVAAIFAGQPKPAAVPLSASDEALLAEVQANEAGIKAMLDAAKACC